MTDVTTPTPPPEPPPKKKKVRPRSRAQRWTDAANVAATAVSQISDAINDLESACEDLRAIQEEYEEWKDNLPENLASSPLGEKLEEVCNLDIADIADNIRGAVDEAESTIGEAESMDLPQGFGRD